MRYLSNIFVDFSRVFYPIDFIIYILEKCVVHQATNVQIKNSRSDSPPLFSRIPRKESHLYRRHKKGDWNWCGGCFKGC